MSAPKSLLSWLNNAGTNIVVPAAAASLLLLVILASFAFMIRKAEDTSSLNEQALSVRIRSNDDHAKNSLSPLSRKAIEQLQIGMTHREVIRILGPATWASLPIDSGPAAAPSNTLLELRWENPECRTISVQFGWDSTVKGWDDGTGYCHTNTPSSLKAFECVQPDRRDMCTSAGWGEPQPPTQPY